MSADTAGRPIATAGCEPGDAVVIVPVPAPGLDTHEPVHATVTRATGAVIYAETDDGERYRRDRLGQLERASERPASGLEATFWDRVAHDSELRRVEADGGADPEEGGEEWLEVDTDGSKGTGAAVAHVLRSVAESLEEAPEDRRYDFDLTVEEHHLATDGGTATPIGGDRTTFASLAFAPEHVAAIRRGEKTATLRLPDEYDAAIVHAAETGAEVLLVTPSGEPFARAAMCGRFELTPAGIARLATLPGYPTALETADDVLRILERHYGEELVDDATFVDVLLFGVTELLRRETVGVRET